MYKKQQQFVSCTICDHDEMKCYCSPVVDMTVRALHPNMLVYNNTIVKDDSTQKQATDSSFLRRYSWGSISSIYYSIFKVKEMYEWSGSRNHWIAIKMSTIRKIKVKNIRCPLSEKIQADLLNVMKETTRETSFMILSIQRQMTLVK